MCECRLALKWELRLGPGLCVSGDWHIAGVGGVLVWWWTCGSGCFPRLLSFGSVGESAMCEW